MARRQLPGQPHPIVSYYRVGRLLHGSLLLFLLESWVYWIMFENALSTGVPLWTVFWGSFFLFSFIHIFLVIMDGWSRYQDYKKAKDLFFSYGFQPRIANQFIGSKCQRSAAIEASRELGMNEVVKDYYRDQGVKWFHYIPYFMVQDPFFMIRKAFWKRTFLEKHYVPKYDFHKMQLQTTA